MSAPGSIERKVNSEIFMRADACAKSWKSRDFNEFRDALLVAVKNNIRVDDGLFYALTKYGSINIYRETIKVYRDPLFKNHIRVTEDDISIIVASVIERADFDFFDQIKSDFPDIVNSAMLSAAKNEGTLKKLTMYSGGGHNIIAFFLREGLLKTFSEAMGFEYRSLGKADKFLEISKEFLNKENFLETFNYVHLYEATDFYKKIGELLGYPDEMRNVLNLILTKQRLFAEVWTPVITDLLERYEYPRDVIIKLYQKAMDDHNADLIFKGDTPLIRKIFEKAHTMNMTRLLLTLTDDRFEETASQISASIQMKSEMSSSLTIRRRGSL